jgi:hypothetical protein
MKVFKTKKQETEFFRSILHRYEIGSRLSDEDAMDLAALLERYPDRDQKVGAGISHFTSRENTYGGRGFFLHRKDGSSTDFSYLRCINGRPPHKQEVARAFRRCIQGDVLERKRELFFLHGPILPCPITGERLEIHTAHMDHKAPLTFEVLLHTFLATKALDYDDVVLSTGSDNQECPAIVDAALRDEFRSYHNRVAILVPIAARANIALASKHRIGGRYGQ